MKKSLLALAVLGAFTGVASAQSSVTVYGFLNQVYGHKAGATALNTWADSGAGSRLGFKGVEDMGGGLKAQFQIETRFSPDDGTTTYAGPNPDGTNEVWNATKNKTENKANPFWSAQSWVGLSHSRLGSLGIGRQYTATFSLVQNTIDPFNGDGYAELRSLFMVGDKSSANYTTNSGLASVRFDNSLRYDYSGYGINFALSIGERSNNGTAYTGATTDPAGTDDHRPVAIAANYTTGPLFLAAGLENPQGEGNYLLNLGAKYNLGFMTASVGFTKGVMLSGGATSTVTAKQTYDKRDVSAFLIGARIPMGKADLKVGYASSTVDAGTAVGEGTAAGATNAAKFAAKKATLSKLALGVDYNFSKRTKVFVDVARYSGDAADYAVSGTTATGIKYDTAAGVGIQHNF